MNQYTIMSYNIENMRDLFKKNKFRSENIHRAQALVQTISTIAPDILGIIEGSEKINDHNYFVNETELASLNYKIAKSERKRGKQELLFYYRAPFELISLDENIDFYEQWSEDIDHDSIIEVLKFERKPLEARFRHTLTGEEILIILVSLKSKGVFSVADIHHHQHLALANRKKLYGQSKKIRQRLDQLLNQNIKESVIVMGDFNDEPGLDHFEKQLGVSALETIMGNLYEPDKILHNTLWHMHEKGNHKELWTTEYPDPIVTNFQKHKSWIDHIFVSPGMLQNRSRVQYCKESGEIADKNEISTLASDHYPVYCKLAIE